MDLSPTQRLAETLLAAKGTNLRDFLTTRAELDVPAPSIARHLAEATDGQVTVTGQAIRVWLQHLRDEAIDAEAVSS